MSFTGSIARIHIEDVAYKHRVREALKHQFRLGLQAWIETVIWCVPVSTGMARASLRPIAAGISAEVGTYIDVPVEEYQIRKPSPTRNPELGESMGQGFESTISGNQWVYTFDYELRVWHYWYNEFYSHYYPNGQMPTPWLSLEKGGETFKQYLNSALFDIPHLSDFVVVTQTQI